ncbi:cell division protein FtsK [Pseudofrankia asymbiotica]|uniref:Cell division protein FtsK n=1 Tax=Pseudofrankia asymbiotica TaxID=1834516 RepID=A0A1V2HZM5_9ACTN|nr:cell division protein FtsK [Pseudofrankia asymbiotica]ONH22127.1 cell division protein FtsK [Pseudofrankia asymbiotica]
MPTDHPTPPAEPAGWVPDIPAVLAELAPAMPARDRSYEWALDPPPGGAPVPVDPTPPPPSEVSRRPVIPPSLRPGQLAATVRHGAGRWAHVGAYHSVRAPWYLVLIGQAAVIGAGRLAAGLWRWWTCAEAAPLRRAAADSGDSAAWLRLDRELRTTRRTRTALVLTAGGGLLAAMVLLAAAMVTVPWPVYALGVALAVAGLVVARRPTGRPLIAPAVVAPRFRKLNADIVLRAYYAARLGSPEKPGQQITFGSTMARDGDGSRVTVDLPYGKGFGDALKAKDAIASGLDVATTQVFLTRDPTSHRRHLLWVGDRDPLSIPAGRTPLLRGKPTDIWTPAPFGLDERARPVAVDLMWNSILVGAQPRQGKTFSLRALGLFAALDPYVKITVADGGGKPDWRRFATIADRTVFGLAPTRDGDPIEILIDALREIRADVQQRYLTLSDMPADLVPEGKLTRDIARDPRHNMPVRILLLDEFQEFFATGNQAADSEIASLLVYLIRVAPAAGVVIGSATQRPSGIGSGAEIAKKFTDYRDNHIIRFALRTGSWQVSDLILGSGAYTEGSDSSTLLAEHKGVGILRGASEANPTVRTYLADAEDADHILAIARVLRRQAGTLTGQAAGRPTTRERRDVLADALPVFGDAPGLHWRDLASRLATAYPEHYRDLTADAISAQLRALGVPSVNVQRDSQVRKGARADAVRAAHRRRGDEVATDPGV